MNRSQLSRLLFRTHMQDHAFAAACRDNGTVERGLIEVGLWQILMVS